MNITSVSLIANEEETIRFDLRNVASKSRYQVRAIIGLDADELIAKFYGFGLNGKKFYDVGLKPRELVMRIYLSPDYTLDETISEVREKVYKAISATRTGQIELQFHSGASTVARTYGFITKFEVPHFSKTPELQITIKCNDAFLRGINPIVLEPSDIPAGNTLFLADSQSTAPHGFQFSLNVTAELDTFTIQDKQVDPEWMFSVVPLSSFQVGDVLHFSSDFTNKYLYMIRGGVTTHLMDKVNPEASIWPIIFPRANDFYLPDRASISFNYIRYDTAYWGV